MQRETVGYISGITAYILWGFIPLYWKLLSNVSAEHIIAHRIIWALGFMVILLLVRKKLHTFIDIFHKTTIRNLIIIFIASVALTLNWILFVIAVNANHVLDTSLGYFLNPLVSVLFAVIFLRERLTKLQTLSFVIALCGVILFAVEIGTVPWIALGLAFSFGLYGLLKKMTVIDTDLGLTLETLFVFPFAFGYLFLDTSVTSSYLNNQSILLLLIGGGLVTAIPLLFYAYGLSNIPLSTMGFLQYIAPLITFALSVFFFRESFGGLQLLGFICIWIALSLFAFNSIRTQKIKQK